MKWREAKEKKCCAQFHGTRISSWGFFVSAREEYFSASELVGWES